MDLDYQPVIARLDGLNVTPERREGGKRKGDAAKEPGHAFNEEKAQAPLVSPAP